MPIAAARTTTQRLLSLLSLLQSRRDWPGSLLAERLSVSERTVRRDVERLRELDYAVESVKGPDGGYRLQPGNQLPPLLFDDEQAVALAIALRTAAVSGAGIEEAATRALTNLRQVLPQRLRGRVDTLTAAVVGAGNRETQTRTEVLLAISAAIRSREELRFDYRSPGQESPDGLQPPGQLRRTQPHHLVLRTGRWYLVGWSPEREDWRIYRADRMGIRTPNGPRFVARDLPGDDLEAFLNARFTGSAAGRWACRGVVTLAAPASAVAPYAPEGAVEMLGPRRCRLTLGAWSWPALAATVLTYDAEFEQVEPADLRAALLTLGQRAQRAGQSAGPPVPAG